MIGIGCGYLLYRLSRFRNPLLVIITLEICAILWVALFLWHFAIGLKGLFCDWRAQRAMCLRRRVDVARPYGSVGRRPFALVRWPIHGHRL